MSGRNIVPFVPTALGWAFIAREEAMQLSSGKQPRVWNGIHETSRGLGRLSRYHYEIIHYCPRDGHGW